LRSAGFEEADSGCEWAFAERYLRATDIIMESPAHLADTADVDRFASDVAF
jgi:hypothetical protein